MNGILLFLGGVGMQEILLIGLFVLIFFGAGKIPEFMRGLGKGVKEFKDGIKDFKKDFDEDENASPKKAAPTPPSTPTVPPANTVEKERINQP